MIAILSALFGVLGSIKGWSDETLGLVDQRAQEAGRPAGDLGKSDPWSRGVFGIRLPRALTAAFVNQALKASEGDRWSLRRHAWSDCGGTAVIAAVAAIDADMRRVRTLLYEAANVMLTRYKSQLKLRDWAFAIAKRTTSRKARVALSRRLAIIMHAMQRDGTEFEPV